MRITVGNRRVDIGPANGTTQPDRYHEVSHLLPKHELLRATLPNLTDSWGYKMFPIRHTK